MLLALNLNVSSPFEKCSTCNILEIHIFFCRMEHNKPHNNKGSIITKTCPCNIQRFFSVVKIKNFVGKILIFFLFLLKT